MSRISRSCLLAALFVIGAAGVRPLPALGGADGALGNRPLPLPFESTTVVKTDALGADFAAKELNEIVKLATGREYKVERWKGGEVEKCGTTPPPHHSTTPPPHHSTTPPSHRIFLGLDPALGEEESAVYAKGNDLYLMGGDTPGMLWAVYDFVEDNLGYHWYDRRPESQVIDRCDTVVYKGVPTRRQPKFLGYRRDLEGHMSKIKFYLRNRENTSVEHFVKGWKHKYGDRTFGHGWDIYLPPHGKRSWATPENTATNCFATHPEWFSLGPDGKRTDKMQLCFSNPATHDAVYASLTNRIAHLGKGLYCLGVNDPHSSLPLCHCEKCQALDRKYDSGGGAMWEMIHDICHRLKRDGFDGVYVNGMAYRRQTEIAPKGLVFPDNFILTLCCGNHTQTLREWGSEPRREAAQYGKPGELYDFYENARAWSKIAPHMTYDYYCDPFLSTTQRMQKEFREICDLGSVDSVGSMGSGGHGGCWAFCDVNSYFYLKLLRDPDLDLEAEAKKVFAAVYGPGAPYVLGFWRDLEAVRLKFVDKLRRIEGFSLFTSEEIVRWGKSLDEGYGKYSTVQPSTVQPSTFNLQPQREAFEHVLMYADMLRVVYADRIRRDCPDYTFDSQALYDRAAKASARYVEKYVVGGHRESGNRLLNLMDQMYYYPNLKSKELPPELKGVDPKKVTRILPPKRAPLVWWRGGGNTCEPDPLAACGFAYARPVPKGVSFLEKPPEFSLYHWAAGKFDRSHIRLPKGFLAADRYKLFPLGESEIHQTECLFFDNWSKRVIEVQEIRRVADPIFLDKKFDVWVSVRGTGPNVIPGGTGEDMLFIDQIFVVEK